MPYCRTPPPVGPFGTHRQPPLTDPRETRDGAPPQCLAYAPNVPTFLNVNAILMSYYTPAHSMYVAYALPTHITLHPRTRALVTACLRQYFRLANLPSTMPCDSIHPPRLLSYILLLSTAPHHSPRPVTTPSMVHTRHLGGHAVEHTAQTD